MSITAPTASTIAHATDANAYANASSEHAYIDANAYANASEKGCVRDATGHATARATGDATADATGHASTEIRDLDLSSTCTAAIRRERSVLEERSAAAPRSSRSKRSLPSPLSVAPAADGNYAVIERIAHEAFDELGATEPTFDVIERVKTLCAQRHIDYGRGGDVALDVVHKAVESAAVQRVLLPTASTRGAGPTSLASLARDFRTRLDAMRTRAGGS